MKTIESKIKIGFFHEGHHLHVVALEKEKNHVKLRDARIVKVQGLLEPVSARERVMSEVMDNLTDEDTPLEISDLIEQELKNEESFGDNAFQITEEIANLFSHYRSPRNRLFVALSEPQIYYSSYEQDWGLKGKKLLQKIADNLSVERQGDQPVSIDELQIIRLADQRILCVAREPNIALLNILAQLRSGKSSRIPNVENVESAEIALVNLVNANYRFSDKEITLIVFLGNEYSRLIFLEGHQIKNISYIIGAGLDAENIKNTIASRIFLEQDNLNLANIDQVILTGEAYEVQLKEFLQERMPETTEIDYLKIEAMGSLGHEPLISRFAVALGAAWPGLFPREKKFYRINLIPEDIRETQKQFKLGWMGWLFLLALPLVAFWGTVQTGENIQLLRQTESRLVHLESDLQTLQDVETRVNRFKNQLSQYSEALSVLDNMTAHGNRWSQFLDNLARAANQVGSLWVTEVVQKEDGLALVRGFATYRSRIPLFSEKVGMGDLNLVEIKQLRERDVYRFEFEAKLP